jgi:hypothetical protein
MFTLGHVALTSIECGAHAAAIAQADELCVLADEKGAFLWKSMGTIIKGFVLALTGDAQAQPK